MCQWRWTGVSTPRKCCVGPFGVLDTDPAGCGSRAQTFLARLENQLEDCGSWDAWAGRAWAIFPSLPLGVRNPIWVVLAKYLYGARGGAGKRAFPWAEAAQRPHESEGQFTSLVGLCSKPLLWKQPMEKSIRAAWQSGPAFRLDIKHPTSSLLPVPQLSPLSLTSSLK